MPNDLSNCLFVGRQFLVLARSIGARSNATGLSALFDEGIELRATHFVVYDEIVDGITAIVSFHYPFTQVKGIGGCHKCLP